MICYSAARFKSATTAVCSNWQFAAGHHASLGQMAGFHLGFTLLDCFADDCFADDCFADIPDLADYFTDRSIGIPLLVSTLEEQPERVRGQRSGRCSTTVPRED